MLQRQSRIQNQGSSHRGGLVAEPTTALQPGSDSLRYKVAPPPAVPSRLSTYREEAPPVVIALLQKQSMRPPAPIASPSSNYVGQYAARSRHSYARGASGVEGQIGGGECPGLAPRPPQSRSYCMNGSPYLGGYGGLWGCGLERQWRLLKLQTASLQMHTCTTSRCVAVSNQHPSSNCNPWLQGRPSKTGFKRPPKRPSQERRGHAAF